ncbi:MAG: M1 family metallopeptidase [Bacteroidales bacterium]
MTKKTLPILVALLLGTFGTLVRAADPLLDVTSYHLRLESDLEAGSIRGSVVIRFQAPTETDSVVFDAGDLLIEGVEGEQVTGHRKAGQTLVVYRTGSSGKEEEIRIDYQGRPGRGLYFDPEHGQAYTMYFTSHWMICNDAPEDKALLAVDLVVPNDKTCVASGELVKRTDQVGRSVCSYRLSTEAPSYTYGFAIGNFHEAEAKYQEISLKYYSLNYTPEQMLDIFRETPAMISFFEEKSGLAYFQTTYTQVLTGNFYQEMSGFSTLKDAYGDMVLRDSTETNLISHEMAHQWWGNRITCKGWNHFWLNEGMATFLSAAYNEQRFGREVYLANIRSYQKVYEGIRDRGNDQSLVFESWASPSPDDRNLVYFKGAYVMHLLKETLGEEAFWDAIRFYSRKYAGKTVETADFQNALEESSGMDLDEFFNEWVYLKT